MKRMMAILLGLSVILLMVPSLSAQEHLLYDKPPWSEIKEMATAEDEISPGIFVWKERTGILTYVMAWSANDNSISIGKVYHTGEVEIVANGGMKNGYEWNIIMSVMPGPIVVDEKVASDKAKSYLNEIKEYLRMESKPTKTYFI